MQRRHNGPGRKRTEVRRGAPLPPNRKKKKRKAARKIPLGSFAAGGFETFLPRSSSFEEQVFPVLLSSAGESISSNTRFEQKLFHRIRQEGFVISMAFHLLITLLLIFEPSFLNPGGEESEEALREDPERLVLFMDEPEPEPDPMQAVPVLPGPEALLLMEEPPQNRLLIPKATRPPPPDKRQDFMNDLPFSEGNTDEFVTDEETEDPGEEGEPGDLAEEEILEEPDNGPGEDHEGEEGLGEDPTAPIDPEQRLADLLPRDDFTFYEPGTQQPVTPPVSPPPSAPPPRQIPRSRIGDGGQGGEGGAFEDIRRFLEDKRFHNVEGGLVTGSGNTLYYNDKGANFVPWISRMLGEVRRNFMMPYSGSFLRGHVAVGVSVLRSGDVAELEIIVPSGTSGFDNAAIGSLKAADLLPLPSDYPDGRFEFILVFWINEQPYQLF